MSLLNKDSSKPSISLGSKDSLLGGSKLGGKNDSDSLAPKDSEIYKFLTSQLCTNSKNSTQNSNNNSIKLNENIEKKEIDFTKNIKDIEIKGLHFNLLFIESNNENESFCPNKLII